MTIVQRQTAQVIQTVIIVDTATHCMTRQNVPTVTLAGWARLAMTYVFTGHLMLMEQSVTALSHVIMVSDVTLNAQEMVSVTQAAQGRASVTH